MKKLIFLGTGHGMPKRSTATSILLKTDITNLLIDCAGGYEVIHQLIKSENEPSSIQNIFISHFDSDHILGIVPLIRIISKIDHKVNLICNESVFQSLESIFKYTANKHWVKAQEKLNIKIVQDGDKLEIDEMTLEFIDSGKEGSMLGMKIIFRDGFSLFYPGDEPIYERYYDKIQNMDLFIHEAFCLEKDIEKYDPHGKYHGTAKEAGENAKRVDAKQLVLFHMEDDTLETRKKEYTAEVASVFDGKIFVPIDLDELVL
jgi:ribonuclease Z